MIDTITRRIWEMLRASMPADNTLFVFSSDHGEGRKVKAEHRGSCATTSKGLPPAAMAAR
ncbi:MAG: hypothetical protein GY903_34085 [Fuerstiella sp.]|nr:hypothetical protein [Fuerstiella sp.]MCP4859525.1 hypothetical protein [Fuerstiella sp.]